MYQWLNKPNGKPVDQNRMLVEQHKTISGKSVRTAERAPRAVIRRALHMIALHHEGAADVVNE